MKKIILWIVGGVFITAGAFFIPEQTGSIWPSVIWSSIAAALYIIFFAFSWLKEITSESKRKGIAGAMAILVLGCGVFATINYEQSQRQEKTLMKIRSTIEQGIALNYINDPLAKTLRAYYTSDTDQPNMGQLFRADYDSLVTEEGKFLYKDTQEDESLRIFLAKASADSVILVGESNFGEPQNAEFSNFSGATGRYQVRGILTSKGVDYEREN